MKTNIISKKEMLTAVAWKNSSGAVAE